MSTLTYPVAATDRAGLTAALLDHYPAAYRLAFGLCGRADVSAAVAARVLARAVTAAGRWASAEQAARWFVRYTVLTARSAMSVPGGVGVDDPALAWLSPLTPQQREAVVLHHGLGLDLHRTAAAMDCSSQAAGNHLAAGERRLGEAGTLAAETAGLPGRLAAVVPPAAVVSADVHRVVRRRWRRVRVRRLAAVLFATVVAATIAWAGWRLWSMLVF